MNNFDTDETINIFRDECAEILSDFDKQLDFFEQNSDVEIVTKLMRDAHSVKGSAGIAGLKSVLKLAHATEDLLGQLKSVLVSISYYIFSPYFPYSLKVKVERLLPVFLILNRTKGE